MTKDEQITMLKEQRAVLRASNKELSKALGIHEKNLIPVQYREMHRHNGEYYDIYLLHKWLGEFTTASAGHKFEIDVRIVEYKEEKL